MVNQPDIRQINSTGCDICFYLCIIRLYYIEGSCIPVHGRQRTVFLKKKSGNTLGFCNRALRTLQNELESISFASTVENWYCFSLSVDRHHTESSRAGSSYFG